MSTDPTISAAAVEPPDCCERHYVQAVRDWPRAGGCSMGVYHAYRMPASAINAAIPEGWTSIVELHRAYVEVLRQLEAADAYTVRLRAELIENAGVMQALRHQRDEAEIARDEARDEIGRLQKSRLLSVLFGHHEGAPRPFALQRTDQSLVALGAEFPDGAVALRLASDGGWTTVSGGGADAFVKDGMEIVWLSDELESLAAMEAQRDAALAELAENTSVMQALRRQRDEAEARIGVNIKNFLAGAKNG